MKLCYNTNGLRNLDLLEAVQEVASAGYEGIELALHPRHIEPFRFSPEAVKRLREELAHVGLHACCLATGADLLLGPERFEPSLISPSREGRQRRVDLLRWSIDLAAELEVPVVNFSSGLRGAQVPSEAAWEMLHSDVSQCLDHAGGRVVLAIEPEPDFFVQTNGEASELIRRLGSGGLRINQDLGHANVCEDDYLDSVARSLPLTAHIHVEDIQARVHRHEIPGEGDIDFTGFFTALRAGDYRGYLSVELYNHATVYRRALTDSLVFLRRHLGMSPGGGEL